MTKEQEAQQAQTIAGIKLWFSLGRSTMKSSGEVEARKRVSDLLEIVDSQAQKIDHQAAELSVTTTMLNDMNEICAEQEKQIDLMTFGIRSREVKIAEQAKEIERLREEPSLPDDKRKYQCKQCGYRFYCAKDNPDPAHSCDERSVCPECESLNW